MDGNRLTVLAVDDDPGDVDLLRRRLDDVQEWQVDFVAFADIESARAGLSGRKADVAIIDYVLGAQTGLDVLTALRDADHDTPVIILTGKGDEHIAVEVMKAGAADYLTKDQTDGAALARSIRHVIRRHEMEAEVGRARRLEHRLAYRDSLTDLPNRKLLLDRLGQMLARSRRYRNDLAVLFLDLDRFKRVNDTLGHSVGDRLLQIAARRLTGCIRQTDTAARLAGDEFVLVLGQVEGPQGAATVARKATEALARPVAIDGQELVVTASVGISFCPRDGDDPEALLRNADAAMYRAKEHGGNCYRFYQADMNAHDRDRMELESHLRRALERGELRAYYQPQVDASSKRIIGAEALMRWRHEPRGLVYPAEFIPLAEQTGLIVPMGEWILHTACAQARAWQHAGFPLKRVAVNLSGRQFRESNLIATVGKALAEARLDPACLALEITESTAMHNPAQAMATLHEAKQMGVQLGVDDFGTGYSSLSCLKRFPLDMLKVDRSFVSHIATDAHDAAITRAIIGVAHSLGLKAIAEGVESAEQDRLLRSLDCDEEQGYLYGKPLPAADLTGLLAETAVHGRRMAVPGRA